MYRLTGCRTTQNDWLTGGAYSPRIDNYKAVEKELSICSINICIYKHKQCILNEQENVVLIYNI